MEAMADVMLRGYAVHSKLPLVGRLVAWVRRNLTSHLREPYMDPMFERQVAFNRQLLALLRQLMTMDVQPVNVEAAVAPPPAPPSIAGQRDLLLALRLDLLSLQLNALSAQLGASQRDADRSGSIALQITRLADELSAGDQAAPRRDP